MSSIIIYPVGAGGNFLLSLMGHSVSIGNNEFTNLPSEQDMKLHHLTDRVDYSYKWYKTHNPDFVKYPFDQHVVISTASREIQIYCNILGSLKIQLNRGRCPNIDQRIHRKWTDFTVDKYTPYEKIFFDLDLDDTLWAGKEKEVRAYTERNIELLHEHGYSTFIPKR